MEIWSLGGARWLCSVLFLLITLFYFWFIESRMKMNEYISRFVQTTHSSPDECFLWSTSHEGRVNNSIKIPCILPPSRRCFKYSINKLMIKPSVKRTLIYDDNCILKSWHVSLNLFSPASISFIGDHEEFRKKIYRRTRYRSRKVGWCAQASATSVDYRSRLFWTVAIIENTFSFSVLFHTRFRFFFYHYWLI